MSYNVSLTASVRQNLLSLQDTSATQSTNQAHLSSGKRVASALDNPVNFFTAASLNNRSSQLANLLDGISNGIQTIQAANKGLTSATSLIQQLQSTVKQARQDATAATAGTAYAATGAANTSTASNNKITFGLANGISVDVSTFKASNVTASTIQGGAFAAVTTATAGNIEIASASLTGGAVSVALADGDDAAAVAGKINSALDGVSGTGGGSVRASVDSTGKLQIKDATGNTVSVKDAAANTKGTAARIGFTGASNTTAVSGTGGKTETGNVALTVDELVASINNNAALQGKVQASKDATSGALKLQSASGSAVTVKGVAAGGVTGNTVTDSVTLAAGTASLSSTRQTLANQFNTLIDQFNAIAKDSGFNGTNLLAGDKLKMAFNEKTGDDANTLEVQVRKADGTAFGALNAAALGVSKASTTADGSLNDFSVNGNLDTISDTLTSALTTIQNQSSQLGSSLAVTQTRQDFTKGIIDVLTTGAGNLTDADMNTEAANSQALSTRQSIGVSALSLANSANQSILQLLR